MASIDESRSTTDSKAIVITFRCWDDSLPVYVLTSVNDWSPMLMTKHESGSEDHHLLEHTVVVWEDVNSIQYKFRIGDSYYLHDDSAPTESDGFGGSNNTFLIPWTPKINISPETTPSSSTSPGTETPASNVVTDSSKIPTLSITSSELPATESTNHVKATIAEPLYVSVDNSPPISETQLEKIKEILPGAELDIGSSTPTPPASNGHVLTSVATTGEHESEELSKPTGGPRTDSSEVEPSAVVVAEGTDDIGAVDTVAKPEEPPPQEPAFEKPTFEESALQEPTREETAVEGFVEEPASGEPVSTQPAPKDPVAEQPAPDEPESEEPAFLSDSSEAEGTDAPAVPYTKTTLWANAEEAAMQQLAAEGGESSDTDMVLDAGEEPATPLQQSRAPTMHTQQPDQPTGFEGFKIPLIFFAVVAVLIAVWLALRDRNG